MQIFCIDESIMCAAWPHEVAIIYSQGQIHLVSTRPAVFPKLEECMHQYRLAPRVLSEAERARGNKASDGSAFNTRTHMHIKTHTHTHIYTER